MQSTAHQGYAGEASGTAVPVKVEQPTELASARNSLAERIEDLTVKNEWDRESPSSCSCVDCDTQFGLAWDELLSNAPMGQNDGHQSMERQSSVISVTQNEDVKPVVDVQKSMTQESRSQGTVPTRSSPSPRDGASLLDRLGPIAQPSDSEELPGILELKPSDVNFSTWQISQIRKAAPGDILPEPWMVVISGLRFDSLLRWRNQLSSPPAMVGTRLFCLAIRLLFDCGYVRSSFGKSTTYKQCPRLA